jgi:hypothetical protein
VCERKQKPFRWVPNSSVLATPTGYAVNILFVFSLHSLPSSNCRWRRAPKWNSSIGEEGRLNNSSREEEEHFLFQKEQTPQVASDSD